MASLRATAAAVELRYARSDEPGLTRERRGKTFRYRDPSGEIVCAAATVARIRALAIPPAWSSVWIATHDNAHIQATGRDARGRKQYRYHLRWREVRDEAKYDRLVAFCDVLPRLRAAVDRDLRCACLCKRKVIATVISLMESAHLRVGNDEYARTNGSYGATTLRHRHATVRGDTIALAYRGKAGVVRRVNLTDRRLARIVRRCRELPGQRLFQYLDGDAVRPISSSDINEYVHTVTGGPFHAKDYRTWAATLGATLLLSSVDRPGTDRGCQRCINEVIAAVAAKLGHTPAVCRASYIHPRLLDDFANDRLATRIGRKVRRRVGGELAIEPDTIQLDALRAIEPLVARYLDTSARRRRA